MDRLEEAGYVRRSRDPEDRRRVIIELVDETVLPVLGPLFQEFTDRWTAMLEGYSTDELQLIAEFTARSNAIAHEATLSLQDEDTTR